MADGERRARHTQAAETRNETLAGPSSKLVRRTTARDTASVFAPKNRPQSASHTVEFPRWRRGGAWGVREVISKPGGDYMGLGKIFDPETSALLVVRLN